MPFSYVRKALTLQLLASVCVAMLAGARTARAETPRAAVLTLGADTPGDPLVAKLTDALRWSVLEASECSLSDTKASLDQLSMLQDCDAADGECLNQIATALSVDVIVYGTISRKGKTTVNVDARVFDKRDAARAKAANVRFTLDATGEADFAGQATLLAEQLFPREKPAPVQRGAAPSAQEVDQPPADAAVATPAKAEPDARASAAPAAADDGPSVRAIAGYSLLGVAVLSVGLTALSFVQVDRAEGDASFDTYRRAVGSMKPGADDVCDEADSGERYGVDAKTFAAVKDQCGTGATYEVLQYVFLGTAVVSGGLSAYLLLADDDGERAATKAGAIALRPVIGRKSAGLSARMRF